MNNLAVLDELCAEHAAYEARCALDENDRETDICVNAHVCLDRIRGCMLDGRVDDAIALAEEVAPGALDEPSFQLEMRLHQLDELVHAAMAGQEKHAALYGKNDTLGLQAKKPRVTYKHALEYVRNFLAPFAQEAFVDAYGIFQKRMLVFVFPERTSNLKERREDIANIMVSTVRARLNAPMSRLAVLIRYLVTIHLGTGAQFARSKCSATAAVDSAILRLFPMIAAEHMETDDSEPNLTGEAFPWNTEPRPLQHNSNARDFSEPHILALCDSLRISMDKAIESLRYANGDVNMALRCELSLIRMNNNELASLVNQYCSTRGLTCLSDDGTTHFSRSLRQMREYASMGRTGDLIRSAIDLDPTLLAYSPALNFRFGQADLIEALSNQRYFDALEIARKRLGPLTKEHSQLYHALRETALLLAFPEIVRGITRNSSHEHVNSDCGMQEERMETSATKDSIIDDTCNDVIAKCSAKSLAGPIYKAVGRLAEEPKLVLLLQVLLETHANWVSASGNDDQFCEFLAIADLRKDEEELCATQSCTSTQEAQTNVCGVLNDASDSERNKNIFLIMEFLAVSRADAIRMLDQYPRTESPQAIIASLLGV